MSKLARPNWFEKLTKKIWVWWVWTAAPALRHPIETYRDWRNPDRHDPPVDWDDLPHLTPEERRALLK